MSKHDKFICTKCGKSVHEFSRGKHIQSCSKIPQQPQLIADYNAIGSSVHLATKYGVSSATVVEQLRLAGVDVRRSGINYRKNGVVIEPPPRIEDAKYCKRCTMKLNTYTKARQLMGCFAYQIMESDNPDFPGYCGDCIEKEENGMAWRIVKQPNGLLARFSDIVDNFTDMNMTEQGAFELCVQKVGESWAKRKLIAGVTSHGLDHWNDCIDTIKDIHGEDEVNRVLEIDQSG